MALANFFFRNVKALDQVISLTDPEKISHRLMDISFAITFNEDTLKLPNTKTILYTIASLVARLYPQIDVLFNGVSNEGNILVEKLYELVKEINPDIEVERKATIYSVALCVGDSNIEAETKIFLMADSWNLEVSINENKNELDGKIANPLSASAVACFGISEAFKIIFSEMLLPAKIEPHYIFSLYNYKKEKTQAEELLPVELKNVHIVGLGAVGNSLIWALSKLDNINGTINLIDDEKVDCSNLQRYILTKQDSIDELKVDVAEQYIKREGLVVNKYPLRLGDYASKYNQDCMFNVIAISVDNHQDRIAAQALLPRVIINAWTGDYGLLGVSRHWFDSLQACLACLYSKTHKEKSQTEKIAEVIGLDARRTANIYLKREKLTKEILYEIASTKNYNIEDLLRWENHTLDELYSEAICGGLLIEQPNSSSDSKELVPLAHQSVLSGILLATELIKESLGIINSEDPVELRFNVLDTISDYVSIPRKKNSNTKCICTDDDYLNVYREKYN